MQKDRCCQQFRKKDISINKFFEKKDEKNCIKHRNNKIITLEKQSQVKSHTYITAKKYVMICLP